MSKKQEHEEVAPVGAANQNMLYGIIIILLIIIAIGGFFLGMKLGQNSHPQPGEVGTSTSNEIAEDITVTVYDDSRCNDCQTDTIMEELKKVPVLSTATFEKKEFSEEGVKEYLESKGIEALPAAIFSTNAVGPDLSQYLSSVGDGEFSLALGASHNPFLPRSENGFLIIDTAVIQEIQQDGYFKGPESAKITWVEYTDVNCGFCQKMEKDGTAETVLAEFPDVLNKTSSNYVGVGGAKTQTAAEIFECVGKEGGADAYNSIMSDVLKSGDNSEETLLNLAAEKGLNKETVKACLDNGDMTDIVAKKFALGAETFGISGTPGNVLINNETGEYEIVSGAYPADTFIATINKLLGQ